MEKQVSFFIPKVWKEFLVGEKHQALYSTGRISGKTKNSVEIATSFILFYPYQDVVIARATYGSISDSMFSEFIKAFGELPNELVNEFEFKKSPLRIERKDGLGAIYFLGVSSSEIGRTRGFSPIHPISLVIVEESQQLNDETELKDFFATLRRFYAPNYKCMVLGNPPKIKAHWFAQMKEEKKYDPDWIVGQMTFRDIWKFLNDFDKNEIIKEKVFNPDNYKWLYCGESGIDGEGQVYPMLKRNIHLVNYEERDHNPFLDSLMIVGAIIGADSSVVRDCTALVCRLIYSDGKSMSSPLIFKHNPKKDGVFSSAQLCENHIRRWFNDVVQLHSLQNVPKCFVVDSAAPELIKNLQYYFGNEADVFPIKKGTIINMVDVVQNAIAKNVCGFYDFGKAYNYTTNNWYSTDNLLVEQYEQLLWNEKGIGYDNIIPNDVSDADTYAIYFYYRQIENLTWLERVRAVRKDYYILGK